MEIFEILLLSMAVAADAFAVALCKGVSVKTNIKKSSLIIGLWFGLFQGAMPLLGYFFMDSIEQYILGIKEFVIFGLLLYIGIMMIIEARKEENLNDSLGFKEMLGLSIATSLDALSVGATLSIYKTNIFIIVAMIALITFVFSYYGSRIGNKFGLKYKSKAEIAGGIVLILIGVRVILEYLI